MFEISVRRGFTAGHALRSPEGPIEEPHEHAFECEVTLASDGVDASGMAIDFRRVDEAMGRIVEPLAGTDLQDTPPFAGESPSAENLARHIHGGLADVADVLGARIVSVKVWEDPDHCATYYENR